MVEYLQKSIERNMSTMTVFGTLSIIAAISAGVVGFIAAWRVRAAREKMRRFDDIQQGQLDYNNNAYLPYHGRHYTKNNPYGYQAEIIESEPIQTAAGTTTEAAILGLAKIIEGIIERNNARYANNKIAAPSPMPQPAPVPMPMPAPAPAPQPMPAAPVAPVSTWDYDAYNDAELKRRITTPPTSSGWTLGADGIYYPTCTMHRNPQPVNTGPPAVMAYNNTYGYYGPQQTQYYPYGYSDWNGVLPAQVPPAPPVNQPPMRSVYDYYDYINDMELKRRLAGYTAPPPPAPVAYPQQPVQQYNYTRPVQPSLFRWQEVPYDPALFNRPYGGYITDPQKTVVDTEELIHFAETMAKMREARAEENRRRREIADTVLLANARPGERIVLSTGQVVYPYG